MKINFIRLKEPWRADPYSDPPLGMLSVLASAKTLTLNGSLELRLVDLAHETEIPLAEVHAISACTLDYPELVRTAQDIKDNVGGFVIAGGPHFDVIPASELEKEIQDSPITLICRGEGEYTFGKAIEYLLSSKAPGKRIITQDVPLLDLNSIPFPAREFLDREKYFRQGKAFTGETFKPGNSSTMMVSRGCPFSCSFCASPEIHRHKVRYRSVENARQELEALQRDYGVTELRFQDDCFTLHPKFKDLANMLTDYEIRYRCSIRVDQVNENALQYLWDSGCRELGFGVESAEDRVLSLINKKTSVQKNVRALKLSKAKGFRTRAFMMTGLPGETKDSAEHMINFLEETKPDVVTLTSFMPLPGCDIYKNPEKYGVQILNKDWRLYDIALKWESHAPFVHRISTASFEEMERNRELLKEYLFNRGLSNVARYNAPYAQSK